MKKLVMLAIVLLVLPVTALAGVYKLRPGLKVTLPELSEPWIVAREATPTLIEHLAEHLQDDAARQGRQLSDEDAQRAARQRLASNELMIYNEKSEAHLLISFEPIGQGEPDPSARAVTLSAQYAASGVTDEGWENVKESHAVTQVKGAQQARWFEISYTEEGKPHLFMGIVGYARPYWFWLYANDHLNDPGDKAVLEKILREIEISVAP